MSPAANVPGPGTAPCVRWWRGRGSWSRDRGRRSRSVGWRAAAARSAGTAPSQLRGAGRHLSSLHSPHNIYTWSCAQYLHNIYTISIQHLTYHTGHMDGQTIYSLAQQILTICTLFTEYLLTFSSSDYLLTTY